MSTLATSAVEYPPLVCELFAMVEERLMTAATLAPAVPLPPVEATCSAGLLQQHQVLLHS